MAHALKTKFYGGELVWVKISKKYPWWPAKVIQGEHRPLDFVGKKLPVATVKFLNEDSFEIIWDIKKIEPFRCVKYSGFIEDGLNLTDTGIRQLFQSALAIAESEINNPPENTAENVMENKFNVNKESVTGSENLNHKGRESGSCANLSTTSDESKSALTFDYSASTNEVVHNSKALRTAKKQDSLDIGCSISPKKVILTNFKKRKLVSCPVSSPQTSNMQSQETSTPKSMHPQLSRQSGAKKTIRNPKSKRKKRKKSTFLNHCSPVTHTPSLLGVQNLDDSWNFDLPTPTSASLLNDDSRNEDTSYSLNCDSSSRCLFDPNISKDSCDSSDSDVELPDSLSPVCGEPAISEKDIILLRWKTAPFWPAYVTKIYKKKRRIIRISVVFISPKDSAVQNKLTVLYSSKNVLSYSSKEKQKIINCGYFTEEYEKNRFLDSCEIAEDYLDKKALGKWKGTLPGIEDSPDSEYGSLDWIEECDCVSTSSSNCSSVDAENNSLTKKELARNEKRKEKNSRLVEFIKSQEMKEYLTEIFNEKRKSDRHRKYKYGSAKEKASIKHAGFGPITNEQQQEEVIMQLLEWLREVTGLRDGELQDVNYVLDVWIPEAVVYGLIKVSGYARSRATRRFEVGIKLTKSELKDLHNSMINSAKNIPQEEWDIHLKQRQLEHQQMKVPFYAPRKRLKLNIS